MYRQGDLLFVQAPTLGENCHLLKEQLDILGSSVTGHTHRISEGEVYSHEPTFQDNARFYVRCLEGAQLLHEEHGTIQLPPGVYKVIRQREVNGYIVD
jgi:hypothetical protein